MTQAPPSRSALDRSRLTIETLTEQSVAAFEGFSCGDADLDDFIRSDALRLQALNVARTYVAHYDGCACGYVALMADDLAKLPDAIGLSRFSRKIIKQNLFIALGVIAVLAPLSALGFAYLGVAVLFHEGSTVVVVLNAMRLLVYRTRD